MQALIELTCDLDSKAKCDLGYFSQSATVYYRDVTEYKKLIPMVNPYQAFTKRLCINCIRFLDVGLLHI